MVKEVIFIDWDDTLVNKTNADDFEQITHEGHKIDISPMFPNAITALKQLREDYHVIVLSSRSDLNLMRRLQLNNYDLGSRVLDNDSLEIEEDSNDIIMADYGNTDFKDKASFIVDFAKKTGKTVRVFIEDDHIEVEAARALNIPTIHAVHKHNLQTSPLFFNALPHFVDNIELRNSLIILAQQTRANSHSQGMMKPFSYFSKHLPLAESLEKIVKRLESKSVEEVMESFNDYLAQVKYNPKKHNDVMETLTQAKDLLESHSKSRVIIEETESLTI